MPSRTSDDDREQLAQFREAWQEFCDTGDESALVELLADDFVWLASWDADPEIGKAEMVEHLQGNPNAEYESERLIVRDEWAVEEVVETVTTVDEETGGDRGGDRRRLGGVSARGGWPVEADPLAPVPSVPVDRGTVIAVDAGRCRRATAPFSGFGPEG